MNKIAHICYLWTAIGCVFSILISCVSVGTYAQTAKDTLTGADKDISLTEEEKVTLQEMELATSSKALRDRIQCIFLLSKPKRTTQICT